MTFELLRCVPVFRLDPVCTCESVCAHVCMFVCMFLYVTVSVLCVCPHMFVSVESKCAYVQYIHMLSVCDYVCVCDCAFWLFRAHIYKSICVCVSLSACARACVTERESACGWCVCVFACVTVCVCACDSACLCVKVCACQGV